MKNTRLNHAKVNALLSDREVNFNLPGGIEQTGVKMTHDGQLGLSDFSRFYVTNAVKAYLGMYNDFDPGGNMSKNKLDSVVIDTLKHYDLLIENDYFYDLFLKSQEKTNMLALENGDTLESKEFDDALKQVDLAYKSLDKINTNTNDNGKPISSVIEAIKADLKKVGESNNISYQDLITELSH